MKLIYWPNSTLKAPSADVTDPVDQVLIEGMYNIMKNSGGVGLSAIQVGIPKKIIVLRDVVGPAVFINAKYSPIGDRVPMLEGCLSIPGFFETVYRYSSINAEWLDQSLQPQKAVLTGIFAHAIQHEIEHTEGKMFVEHLSSADRSRILGTMLKLKKSGQLK